MLSCLSCRHVGYNVFFLIEQIRKIKLVTQVLFLNKCFNITKINYNTNWLVMMFQNS
jgi:hypothetical protein